MVIFILTLIYNFLVFVYWYLRVPLFLVATCFSYICIINCNLILERYSRDNFMNTSFSTILLKSSNSLFYMCIPKLLLSYAKELMNFVALDYNFIMLTRWNITT
jgi:hypothetical protein